MRATSTPARNTSLCLPSPTEYSVVGHLLELVQPAQRLLHHFQLAIRRLNFEPGHGRTGADLPVDLRCLRSAQRRLLSSDLAAQPQLATHGQHLHELDGGQHRARHVRVQAGERCVHDAELKRGVGRQRRRRFRRGRRIHARQRCAQQRIVLLRQAVDLRQRERLLLCACSERRAQQQRYDDNDSVHGSSSFACARISHCGHAGALCA
jgi:hypothetical protein